MKKQSIFICVVLVCITLIWYILSARPSTAPTQHVDSCRDSNIVGDIEDYYNSVAVIYDYSTISPQQLRDDVKVLQEDINQQLISELILVENKCGNTDTSAAAAKLAKTNQNLRVVVVEAEEVVSTGRARIAAVSKTTAPFILFVSTGSMPDSPLFIEHLLGMVMDKPSQVVVPSRKGALDNYQTFSWSLRLQRGSLSQVVKQQKPLHLPVIDNSAFFIRSDMYKAVGGYDSLFYKRDSADIISLSLAVWLCGGTVVRSECAHVTPTLAKEQEVDTVSYLQHAKYIQQVFGGSLVQQFNYPGIEFYNPSSYDQHAVASRKELFKSKGCMTMEWYAHKFKDTLPIASIKSRFYNPNYKPSLPVYEKILPEMGKWFVLFAGNCVKITEDAVLGLSWCPKSLTDNYIFNWKGNGQIRTKRDKCVTLRAADSYLVVDDCMSDGELSQQFKYDKSKRYVVAVQNKQCITHFNGESNRQVLRPMPCEDNSPFNKFVLNDDY